MSIDESNIERLLAQFHRKKLDRVPNFEEIIGKNQIEAILKREVPGCTRDLSPNDYVDLARKIGMDAIVFYSNQNFGGEQYVTGGDSSEQKQFYVNGDIKDWDDLKRIISVDLDEMTAKLEFFINATAVTNIGICAWVVTAFTRACLNMGYESFMYKLYDDYEFIKELFKIQLDNAIREADAVSAQDISFVTFGDDLTDKNDFLISPKVLEELYFPTMKKMVQHVKSRGKPVMFHCCGNLEKVVPYLIDIGVDAIHPFQSICNDIYQMKKKYGDKICLVGNIGVTEPLTFGSEADVIADVKYHIDNLAKTGGYVLCSDHSIADCIPANNFLAMVNTGHTYGVFK